MTDFGGRTIDSPDRIRKATEVQMRNQGFTDGRSGRAPRSDLPIYRQAYRRGVEARRNDA